MKKRIGFIISLVLLLVIFLPATPVFAYELPDTIQIIDVDGYQNLVSDDDMLIIFWYEWSYDDANDIPDTPAPNIFTFSLIDTDGTTIIATQSPYALTDGGFLNGFQEGISGFYFTSADNLTYGSSYTIRISAIPGAFASPPSPVNLTLTGADYTESESQDTNQTLLETWIAFVLEELGNVFDATFIGQMEYGDILNAIAEVYVRGAIRGIQAMAPSLFLVQITAPTWSTQSWSTNQTGAYASRYSGTIIGNAAIGLGDLLGIGGTLAFGSVFLIAAVWLVIGARRKYQSPAPGFIPAVLCILAGVLMGGVNGAIVVIMGIVGAMIVGYMIWRPVG